MSFSILRNTIALVTMIIALASNASIHHAIAQQTAPQQAKLAQIDKNGVLILIRTTLIALDQANKTSLYTVLRDIGAPAFQGNSAAKLADIFAPLRKDKLDLSATAVLEPQLTEMPQIYPNGLLQMAGYFPSVNEQIYFDLAFAPVDGQWRLFGISVRRGSAGPIAPQAPVAQPSASPKPIKQ
jgi:hypothetical protein